MTSNFIALINSKIRLNEVPIKYQDISKNARLLVSHEMIYFYIWSDKKRGGMLFQYLRRKGKAYQSRSNDKQASRGFIKN